MTKSKSKLNKYYLYILLLVLAILPLIVRFKLIHLTGSSFEFWTGQQYNYDLFSYYKSIFFIIISSLAIIIFIYYSYFNSNSIYKNSFYYIPIVIYSIAVVLSTILSEYRNIAIHGFPDRYEGMFVLLAYMIVLFIGINSISKEEHSKMIIYSIFLGALIIGLIGIFQYLGYDFFKSDFGKYIMLPSEYIKGSNKLNYHFNKYWIYATLYHPDYVGSYTAMILPLCTAIFVLIKNKKIKVLAGFLTIIILINWIGCNSRAGFVGGILAIIVFLIMINNYILNKWKFVISGLLIVMLLMIGINNVSQGVVSSRLNSLLNDVKTVFSQTSSSSDKSERDQLEDIKISGNTATVVMKPESITLEVNNNNVTFKDLNGNPLKLIQDKQNITLKDNRYKEYDVQIGLFYGKRVIIMEKGQIKLYFGIDTSKITLLNNKATPIEFKPVEKWGFEGKELMGSSRGYIWSRSIPLLKDTILIGHGPDTFAAYFPQYDLIGKQYAYAGDMWQLVDKPHDLYLQVGINTGIVSLLALLLIFGVYIVNSIRTYYRRQYQGYSDILGLGIFTGICGYLVAAFFNDSVVSVAPVFWTLLGLGISINYMINCKVK